MGRDDDILEGLKRERPESEVLAALLEYLQFVPTVHVWRQNVGAARFPSPTGRVQTVRFGFAGLPDICGWVERKVPSSGSGDLLLELRAQPLYIEAKRADGHRRPAQLAFIELAQRTGCLALFASGVDELRVYLRAKGVHCP